MALRSFGDKTPTIGTGVYVDEAATVIGEVHLHDGSSVWPGAVLRADSARVDIGKGTAMMDLSFAEAPKGRPVVVGDRCIVSHGAKLHGCVVLDDTLIGIGATVLDGANIGARCVVAAGALVPPGARIPPESLVMGVPAEIIRKTDATDLAWLAKELESIKEKVAVYSSGRI